MRVLCVGAGFSGAVIANVLARQGYYIDVVDSREHIAGNCYSERDASSGVMVHRYGPHIFHTDSTEVWEYVTKFSEFVPYVNRVKATVKGGVYSLPINLHTINQFFGNCFSPQEAKDFIEKVRDKTIREPRNFEEQALSLVGRDLYEAFLKGYTTKQWGINPTELPASILKRLPIRFNYDDNYYNHSYQGMPKGGYTELVQKILDLPNITVHLNQAVRSSELRGYDHVFYSGPIDSWFNYSEGRLGYRTLDFEEIRNATDIQGCAVMNYGDISVPYTRIAEHKYFSPWESNTASVAFREYSRACQDDDIPYYPIRLTKEQALLRRYIELASAEKKVSFVGRLGTYRYIDMDITIAEALNTAKEYISLTEAKSKIPAFFINPL